MPVILDGKSDVIIIQALYTVVTDGNLVGIAAKIFYYLCWT